jgi:hypothetical protein
MENNRTLRTLGKVFAQIDRKPIAKNVKQWKVKLRGRTTMELLRPTAMRDAAIISAAQK